MPNRSARFLRRSISSFMSTWPSPPITLSPPPPPSFFLSATTGMPNRAARSRAFSASVSLGSCAPAADAGAAASAPAAGAGAASSPAAAAPSSAAAGAGSSCWRQGSHMHRWQAARGAAAQKRVAGGGAAPAIQPHSPLPSLPPRQLAPVRQAALGLPPPRRPQPPPPPSPRQVAPPGHPSPPWCPGRAWLTHLEAPRPGVSSSRPHCSL